MEVSNIYYLMDRQIFRCLSDSFGVKKEFFCLNEVVILLTSFCKIKMKKKMVVLSSDCCNICLFIEWCYYNAERKSIFF